MDLETYRVAAETALTDSGVLVAYLFGSRARGDHRATSDVDIAVLLSDDIPHEDFMELTLTFARELERLLHLPVSPVVVLNDAPLRLQGRVLRDGRPVLVSDEGARVRYETTTRTVAGDFETKARALDRLLLAAHAAGTR